MEHAAALYNMQILHCQLYKYLGIHITSGYAAVLLFTDTLLVLSAYKWRLFSKTSLWLPPYRVILFLKVTERSNLHLLLQCVIAH